MSAIHRRILIVRLGYLLVGMLALSGSGCLAVLAGGAVVAGGAAGAAYLTGGVGRDFKVGFPEALAQTKLALVDFGMTLTKEKTEADSVDLESMSGTGQPVFIHLKTRLSEVPAEGPITTVEVRVGPFGDRTMTERFGAEPAEKPLSEKLLNQIGGRLSALPRTLPLPTTGALPPGARVVQPAQWTLPNAPPPLRPTTEAPPLATPTTPVPVPVGTTSANPLLQNGAVGSTIK